jgi:outer membrane immunogenic protein
MKKLMVAAAAIAALSTAASAADMPVKAPHPYVPACAQFGGFYVGGSAGGTYYHHNWNDRSDLNGIFGPIVPVAALGATIAPKNTSNSDIDWNAGVQAGFNWQSGCNVFGVQADWSWTGADVNNTLTPSGTINLAFPGIAFTERSQLRSYGTLRARTGLVVENLLLYVTGGVAFANFRREVTLTAPAAVVPVVGLGPNFSDSSRVRLGWAAGAGAEWAFARNWSLVTEFLMIGFQRDTATFTYATPVPIAGAGGSFTFDRSDLVFTTKIGVNYRFGYDPPVRAAY